MPLDPQARVYLDKLESLQLPGFHEMEPVEARKLFKAMRGLAGKPDPVEDVRDEFVPDAIPIRIYRPLGAAEGPLPALVFFHGGGWVLGDIETVDNLCRRLANASGCVVVSVDYCLSPEHKFPDPLHDCWMAVATVGVRSEKYGIDPDRIAVGGDSAGANLAAAVTLKFREIGLGGDRGAGSDGPGEARVEAESKDNPVGVDPKYDYSGTKIKVREVRPIAFQLLIYPITDHSFDTPSYRENGDGYGLSREMMTWYWEQYLARPEDGRSPLASPLRADNLAGLPPAMVITAGFDVLRDEGRAYARRLREAGVPVEERHYPGMIHGFFQMADSFDEGKAAIQEAGRILRKALAP